MTVLPDGTRAAHFRKVRKELRALARSLADVVPPYDRLADEDGDWLVEEAEDTLGDLENTATLIRGWLAKDSR